MDKTALYFGAGSSYICTGLLLFYIRTFNMPRIDVGWQILFREICNPHRTINPSNSLRQWEINLKPGQVMDIIADDLVTHDNDHIDQVCLIVACGKKRFFALLRRLSTVLHHRSGKSDQGIQLRIERGTSLPDLQYLFIGKTIQFTQNSVG